MLIDELCKKNRFSKFQKSRLFSSLNDEDKKLYKFVDDYFQNYCEFFRVSVDDIHDIKERFANDYTTDIYNFIETGKYPAQLTPEKQRNLERIEYDIILISSYLLEKHRFEMLKWLAQKNFSNKKILAIGVGPGVEIGLILDFLGCSCSVEGYDLEFSDYVSSRYGNKVRKKLFTGTDELFDVVILIEVLEHLYNPLDLLNVSSKSMALGGYLYATTAINIPQFDHLYNFKENEVLDLLAQCGLDTVDIRKIEHATILSQITSINEIVEAVKR